MSTFQLLTQTTYQTIVSHTNTGSYDIIMTDINNKDEYALDHNQFVILKRGNRLFIINPKDVYFYGDVDFTTGSEDMEAISNVTWFNQLKYGIKIPSDYDYETHSQIIDGTYRGRTHETFKPELVVQYKHGCLGKPKKIVIFKMLYKNIIKSKDLYV